jgi:DNA polymerase-3 subunit gamma/tau
MSYLVLARKYRPQRFQEIIGQEHIVTTLKNALISGKIWHAYIFSGTRGTGKTSTARIFAKAVNCLSPTADFEPCNKCKNCIEITQGDSLDVIEIDAASNRGIDEIRSLRESVKYVPVSCKYKVYIIDEAHQITEAAFNAFLKTLEEPPSYVIFILATTEFNALPTTIVSRCQVFQFRPITKNIIFDRLKFVVSQEGKTDKITDDALQLIADTASGSVRDALSLLDQILALTEIHSKVDSKLLRQIWGFTPNEVLEKYVELILNSEIKPILDFVEEIYTSGIDFIQLSKDLLEFFHKLLYLKSTNKVETTYNLEKFKDKFSTTHIIAYIQQLLQLVNEIKYTEFPKLVFEIYSVKLTKQYLEINEIIKNLGMYEEKQKIEKETDNIKTISEENLKKEQVLTEKTQQTQTTEDKSIESAWEEILEKIRLEKPLSYPILMQSKLCFYDDTLRLFLPNKYVKTMIEQHNLNLEKILENKLNKKVKVIYDVLPKENIVLGEDQPPPNIPEGVKPIIIQPKKPKITPEIEKFCKAFSGKIISSQNDKN